jgi:tetratricopeptide (TPR) repeat protein
MSPPARELSRDIRFAGWTTTTKNRFYCKLDAIPVSHLTERTIAVWRRKSMTTMKARPCLLCILACFLYGCGSSNPPASMNADPDASPGNPPQSTKNGHDRMVQELAALARANPYERLFFGNTLLASQELQLSYLPETDKEARFTMLLSLGKRQLWLGECRPAINHLEDAFRIVQSDRNKRPDSRWGKTLFQLALANLRLGEMENCVHCNNGDSCLLPIRAAGIHAQQEGSQAAIKHFTQFLNENPAHSEARWMLNIAYMTIGGYPDQVPSQWRISPDHFQSVDSFPKFANIASDRSVDLVNLSGGMTLEDFDGDGDLDMMTSSWNLSDPIHFFRNEQGKFIESSEQAGLVGITGGLNMIHADYDNDGDNDVLVLRGAWMEQSGDIPNSLLQNDGKGNFRDVTFESGLGDKHHPTQTACWLDYDNDGDLDLYIGNERVPCELFQNDGKGHFVNVAKLAGVENGGFTKGVVSEDVNNDNYPDIYVSNQGEPNLLLINNRDGTFTDVAEVRNVADPLMSFATWFWDFDQDGHLDLYVTSYSYGPTFVDQNYLGIASREEPNMLYRGDGQGGFVNVAEEQKLTKLAQPMGANFGDLDNDGYPDFYLGTGFPGYEALMPNLMFWNQRGKGFMDVTIPGGFGHLQKGHAISFADFDNDGDQDVFAEMGGAFPGDAAANCLFENPGFENSWITIKLTGTQSNRSAIGARIEAEIYDGENLRTVHKRVGSGGSFGSNPLRQEIGLGQAKKIERLTVYWPTSSQSQTMVDVPVGKIIEITEPSSSGPNK